MKEYLISFGEWILEAENEAEALDRAYDLIRREYPDIFVEENK